MEHVHLVRLFGQEAVDHDGFRLSDAVGSRLGLKSWGEMRWTAAYANAFGGVSYNEQSHGYLSKRYTERPFTMPRNRQQHCLHRQSCSVVKWLHCRWVIINLMVAIICSPLPAISFREKALAFSPARKCPCVPFNSMNCDKRASSFVNRWAAYDHLPFGKPTQPLCQRHQFIVKKDKKNNIRDARIRRQLRVHLQVIVRVPIRIVNDDGIGGRKVQPKPPSSGGQQHHKALELGPVEAFDGGCSHVGPRVAVQSLVLVPRPLPVHAAFEEILRFVLNN